jgi:glycosyltransferase involved in cell wall biosynthesis
MKNRVIILGLDNFSQKNLAQLFYLNKHNFYFDIFTIDNRNNSAEIIDYAQGDNCLVKVQGGVKGIIGRAIKLIVHLATNRKSIHHIEIYPNAPFATFYIIAAKIFGVKTIVVERGDIGDFAIQKSGSRLSMALCYKLGDAIWYKEPYMKPILERMTNKKLVFIHNAADYDPSNLQTDKGKSIDFLWVNRLHPMRKAEWVVKAMKDTNLQKDTCTFIGFQDFSTVDPRYLPQDLVELQHKVIEKKGPNITILNYTNPVPHYAKAKFFVLPAERVFGNNSLLEAMSYGVVPIVTNANHTEQLIQDNYNGLLCEYTESSFIETMKKASKLTESEYKRLSANAANTIRDRYNNEKWAQKLLTLYRSL